VILADVNVLLCAYRSEAPGHKACRAWLESVVNGDAPYGMSPQVLSSLVRIATHPRVFVRPSGIEETLEFVSVLLDQPHCQVVQPGPRHWSIFRRICRESGTRGNLVQDARFAALAIDSGCEWITPDRDYARLAGLRWSTPF